MTTMGLSTLGHRGHSLASNPALIDIALFEQAIENQYHPENNPQGAFALNVAENNVMGSMIRQKLEELMSQAELPSWVLQYTSMTGHPEVREIISAFMRKYFGSPAIAAENIVFSAGASASLEVLSFVLADPGDVVVIPAPSYPMYTKDLGVKSGMERYDLQTHHDIAQLDSLALVSSESLNKALSEIQAQGKKFRLLLITSPDNPSGSIYSEAQLRELANWCMAHEIHLLVNEIYALSPVDHGDSRLSKDYSDPFSYFSFTRIMAEYQSPYLHHIYALSKDFAASGLRFGIIHTLNEQVLQATNGANIPHMVSNLTQWLIGQLFSDETFIADYIEKNRQSLTKNYSAVIDSLRTLDIPYVPSRGSLFVWADFSKYLAEDTKEGEMAFWQHLYEHTGVLLTPGVGFQHSKRGMFRIVHTVAEPVALEIALSRLRKYLSGKV